MEQSPLTTSQKSAEGIVGAPQARLDAAIDAGAVAALNIETHNETQRLDWVLEQTSGRGADVTIEATGAPEAVAAGPPIGIVSRSMAPDEPNSPTRPVPAALPRIVSDASQVTPLYS